jgi:hypothetical protein
MLLHMIYLLCQLHSNVVNFVPKIIVNDFDARLISRGLESNIQAFPYRQIRFMLLLFLQILFPVIFIKCCVRWDGTSQILKLSFGFGHPCSTCSHTCSSTAADPQQRRTDLLSFPDLHDHLSVFLARLGLHKLRRLLHLCMMVDRSGGCSSVIRRMVVPFCWSGSVGPCYKYVL